jgi:tetratricopeptide (TPR) repeat protein
MKKAWLLFTLAVLSFDVTRAARPGSPPQNTQAGNKIGIAIADLSKGRYDDAISAANIAIDLLTNVGVGVSLFYGPDFPLVNEVFPASPAENAGIKSADEIIKIGGKSIKGWTGIRIRAALNGSAGKKVLLTLERVGTLKPIQVTAVQATAVSKEAASAYGIISLAFRYKGNRENAVDNAEKANSLNPGNEWACLSLAAVHLDAERYEEAIKLLSPLRGAHVRLLEAAAVIKLGKAREAVDIYGAIPEKDMPPENAMIAAEREALLQLFKPLAAEHRAKARLFELKKQYPEALAELSEALLFADKAGAELDYAVLFGIVRKMPSALDLPEEARKHALWAELQIKDGNFELAAKEYRMAIRIAPYAARLYYNLALLNETIKNYAEAIRSMKLYLQAVPDAPDARAAKDAIIKWEFEMEKAR